MYECELIVQEKDRPQSKKPLEMIMTGKERKNLEDWRAEREKYDRERLERQQNEGGGWRRAWDVDKIISSE